MTYAPPAPVRKNVTVFHKLTHRLRPSLWTTIDHHLWVPSYRALVRQRCICGTTRVIDLIDPPEEDK